MPGRQALLVALAVLAVLLLAGCAAGAPRAAGFAGREGLAGQSSLVPLGLVVASVADEVPAGWLECDGGEVGRLAYPGLYAVVGDAFGPAPEGYFRLPDLRGRFVRCVDNRRGLDPGRAFGSFQENALQYHRHRYPVQVGTAGFQTQFIGDNTFSVNESVSAMLHAIQKVSDEDVVRAGGYNTVVRELLPYGGADKTAPISMTVRFIISALPLNFIPSGVLLPYVSRGQPPQGWLKCDGQEYDPDDYVELAASLGGKFNNRVFTEGFFQVPDTGGLFLEGTSDAIGVINAQAMKNHTHSVKGIQWSNTTSPLNTVMLMDPSLMTKITDIAYRHVPYTTNTCLPGWSCNGPIVNSFGVHASQKQQSIVGANVYNEIRPKNISIGYIIKT